MGRLSWFPKFILIPAGFVALGYWVVGPRLAGNTKVQKLVRETAQIIPTGTKPEPEKPAEPAADSTPAAPASDPAVVAPDVSVAVKPATEEDKPKPRRRRKRRVHHAAKPAEDKPADAAPAGPDPGSTPDQ